MGQVCQHCFWERPVAVNDDDLGAARGKKRSRLDPIALVDDNEQDGYSKGAMTNIAGMKRADPNYRSKEIGIEDFQIIKVIGRGSFGKVYLV